MALFDRDAAGARDILQAGKKREVGVADGQSFEINVTARHYVEQVKVSVAVEDGLTIAGRFDDEGLFRRAAVRHVIGSIGWPCSPWPSVFHVIVLIKAGMHQDDIAGLGTRRVSVEVIGMRGARVVRRHQSGKGRLLLLALIIGGIHVIDLAALRGFRLKTGPHRNQVFGFPNDAIRIR